MKQFIQGYFLLDKIEITPEYDEQLNYIKKQYLIEWDLLSIKNNKELYLGVLRDESKLYDSEDEEGIVSYGLISAMQSRNLEIIGIWNSDGTELGTTKNITPAEYSEQGELIKEEIIEITGESKYPFNKSLYIASIEPRIAIDEDGNVLSTEEFYDLRSFGNFGTKINFKVSK